jgi:hypothetical protein
VILANAYNACNMEAPWKFWGNRCFRTLKNLKPHFIMTRPSNLTHHNALDDAVYQAMCVQAIYERLDLRA